MRRYKVGSYGAMVEDENGQWVEYAALASDPPGLVELVREYQAIINGYGDGEQNLQELDGRLAVVQEQLLAYPLPASPQAETTKGGR